MRKLGRLLWLAGFVALGPARSFGENASSAPNATSNRIDGVAKFLVKRANQNAVYILQQNMRQNRTFQCLFPETYKVVSSDNLDLFLQSGEQIWKKSVDADLKNIETLLLVKAVDPKRLSPWIRAMNLRYAKVLMKIRVVRGGRAYTLKEAAESGDPELKRLARDVVSDYHSALTKAMSSVREMQSFQTVASTECPTTPEKNAAIVADLLAAKDDFDAALDRLRRSDVVMAAVNESTSAYAASLDRDLDEGALADIAAGFTRYQKKLFDIDASSQTVIRMFQIAQLIGESVDSNDPLVDKDEYASFSRYAISFALLSEAKSADQVTAIMEQLALPPVSFFMKRKQGAHPFLITAYFAGAGGLEFDKRPKGYGGLTVPVGLEYSRGVASHVGCPALKKALDGSWSVMLAPVDFAHPANENINNASGNTAQLKDIVSPGVYLSHGLKDWPVVVGLGYNYGPAVTQSQQSSRGRGFLFLGLDLPLYPLF